MALEPGAAVTLVQNWIVSVTAIRPQSVGHPIAAVRPIATG
ncbi:hypothetical protein [Streptomyces sp. x-80]